MAGSVKLDAQAFSDANARRVLRINPGSSSDVVQLIGLNITGGYEQGGGVYVQGGTVAISSCNIYGNSGMRGIGGGV
eukprot:jgi/Chrpa1/24946/Chrysochromulina_OHIO_Genome00024648-RA